MRQIFSSPRLENVERVEQLLEEAGIDTRVTDRATWNRATKRDFSYTEKRHQQRWPVLWVVKSDDYPRARQIMRDLGLLEANTRDASYFSAAALTDAAPVPRTRGAGRLRLVLLGAAVLGAVLVTLKILGVF